MIESVSRMPKTDIETASQAGGYANMRSIMIRREP